MDLIDTFRLMPWFYIGTLTVLGLVVGSFLNVVIHRLPKMLEAGWRQECTEFLFPGDEKKAAEAGVVENAPKYNLVEPRSACPSCGHQITALENIPVFSYVVLGGKCSACKTRISLRYPIVEVVTGALTALVAWRFGVTSAALFACAYLWALIALTYIDADTKYLPDDINMPLLWLGVIANLSGTFVDLKASVIGAIAGYGILWVVATLFKLLRKQEGMGAGDFKLLGAIGAWLGWQMLPLVILLSATVGTVVGVYGMIFRGRNRDYQLPFGPYLAAAGFLAMIWGPAINHWYLNLGRVPG